VKSDANQNADSWKAKQEKLRRVAKAIFVAIVLLVIMFAGATGGSCFTREFWSSPKAWKLSR
jgi:hypothetical protein